VLYFLFQNTIETKKQTQDIQSKIQENIINASYGKKERKKIANFLHW
jgi:low affinity Fe/Cu permease